MRVRIQKLKRRRINLFSRSALMTVAGFAIVGTIVILQSSAGTVSQSQMRARWLNLSVSNNSIKNGIKQWNSMDKTYSKNYLWSDTKQTSDITNMSESETRVLRQQLLRLRDMAMAYAAPASSVKGNSSLAKDLDRAIRWTYDNWYNETTNSKKDWWNVHGLPREATDVGVLFSDGFSSATKAKWASAVKDNMQANVWKEHGSADNMGKVKAQIGLGLFSGETALINSAVERAAFGLKFSAGRSYKKDGTYEYHNAFYNGGYGISDVASMTSTIMLVAGSSYDFTSAQREFAYNRVFETFEPIVFEGRIMEFARGREVSRGTAVGSSSTLTTAALILSDTALGNYKQRMQSLLKSWLQADTSNYPNRLSGYAKVIASRILKDTKIKPAKTKNRLTIFAQGDAASYFGDDFAVTIKMHSKRNASFETNNGENIKGWYQSEGVVQLYTKGSPRVPVEYRITIDPQRLPGTTVSTKQLSAISKFVERSGLNKDVVWVGGSQVGVYGAIGQQINSTQLSQTVPANTVDVQAKKSWFIFDETVVALGADINSGDSAYGVETIVDNRIVTSNDDYSVNGQAQSTASGAKTAINNTKWAHSEDGSGPGVGYYFPTNTTLKTIRETRSGSKTDISNYGSNTDAKKATWLTTYLSHGVKPSNKTYKYVLLPNKTKAETQSYASSPGVDVLSNSKKVQAVQAVSGNYVGANFWSSSAVTVKTKLGDVGSSNKTSITLVRDGGQVAFAVSDPTQLQTTVRVCFGGATGLTTSASNVAVISRNPLVLDINVRKKSGASITAKFDLAASGKSCDGQIGNTDPDDNSSITPDNTQSEPTPTPDQTPDTDNESTPPSDSISSDVNLVVNPNFDNALSSWSVSPTSNVAVSDLAAKLSARSSRYVVVSQEVAIRAGDTYRFAATMKLSNVVSSVNGAYLAYRFLDSGGKSVSSGNAGVYLGTKTINASTDKVAPANAVTARISLVLGPGSGTVIFDYTGIANVTPGYATPHIGDIADGNSAKGSDGKVDFNDLAYLVGKFNQRANTAGRADINGDGVVDIKDIVQLLSYMK